MAEPLQEDKFRRDIIQALEDSLNLTAHVSYIESHQVTAGIPDLHVLAYKEIDAWIELKVVKMKGKSGSVTVRPSQKMWHRKRHNAGGKSWFVVQDTNENILVVLGSVAIELPPRVEAWREAAEHVYSGLYEDQLNLMLWRMK